MKFLIVVMSIFLPVFMYVIQKIYVKARFVFNIIALLAALIFGNIASFAIYEVLKDRTVFMTNIHAIFLNPFFLITGGYLGIYIVYRMLLLLESES